MDSGCSNHMSGFKSLFSNLDESMKQKVHLDNGNTLYVEGKSTMRLELGLGNFKFLHNMQYVPALDFNLVSVGQLMRCRYLVLFDNAKCNFMEKKTNRLMISIAMTRIQMFPYIFPKWDISCLQQKQGNNQLYGISGMVI